MLYMGCKAEYIDQIKCNLCTRLEEHVSIDKECSVYNQFVNWSNYEHIKNLFP